jgi:hypothetical protein
MTDGAFHHGLDGNARVQQRSTIASATNPNALLRATADVMTPARMFHFIAFVVKAK